MKLNSIKEYKGQNNSLNFKAKLELTGKDFKQYKKNNNITSHQIKEMTDKFTKTTENIKGTLRLDFGEAHETFIGKPAHIAYVNNNCVDKIPVELSQEKWTTVDKYVEKLIGILNIFKTREKSKNEIECLLMNADNIAQKTQEESLEAAEKLFNLRNWRNKTVTDKGLSSIFEQEPFNLYEADKYQGFDYTLKNKESKILEKKQPTTMDTETSKPYDDYYTIQFVEEIRASRPRRRVNLDDVIYG